MCVCSGKQRPFQGCQPGWCEARTQGRRWHCSAGSDLRGMVCVRLGMVSFLLSPACVACCRLAFSWLASLPEASFASLTLNLALNCMPDAKPMKKMAKRRMTPAASTSTMMALCSFPPVDGATLLRLFNGYVLTPAAKLYNYSANLEPCLSLLFDISSFFSCTV